VHTAIAVVSTLVALALGGLVLGGGTRAAVLVFLLGLVATALPVTLFLVGIKRIGPARAAIYSTLEPAITVGLAALVLGERISAGQLFGGLLIVAAVLGLALERLAARAPAGRSAGRASTPA
jgi:drug/metabolite transporter (DMT)-like permease